MMFPSDALDPLSKEEIELIAASVREHFDNTHPAKAIRFNAIALIEPGKNSVHGVTRRSRVILLIPADKHIFEVIVALHADGLQHDRIRVAAVSEIPVGFQPVITVDDCLLVEKICRESTSLQKEIALRFKDVDFSNLVCDPWSIHVAGPKEKAMCKGRRLVQAFLYIRKQQNDNQYSHPLDIVPVVDLDSGIIADIHVPPNPPWDIAPHSHNYTDSFFKYLSKDPSALPWRNDLKPLHIIQPQGPSFQVTGRTVTWADWSFHVGFNYREGVVLNRVQYANTPILYRASLAEMAVPYGDVNDPYQRKCAFDAGDYGLGFCANSLSFGCDCLGAIHYFDGYVNNAKGEAVLLKNAVCLHEEDVGLLWKHVDYRTGHAEVRRGRRLVLSFIATVVNYEYAFYWSFHLDGTIEFEIKLTGILSTNMPSSTDDPSDPRYGTLIAPFLNAQYHQHLFSVRLDMSIGSWTDGNTVLETDIEACALDPLTNPYGNGFVTKTRVLATELEAMRSPASDKARKWTIINPHVINPSTGRPVGYSLIPEGTHGPLLLAHETSALYRRAFFATKALFVTPYAPQELYPSGEFTVQAEGGEGLEKWTREDRRVEDTDVVLWHTLGVTHVPRPEDYPVMPVERVSFRLKPFGFFSSNPSINVPPNYIINKEEKQSCSGHA